MLAVPRAAAAACGCDCFCFFFVFFALKFNIKQSKIHDSKECLEIKKSRKRIVIALYGYGKWTKVLTIFFVIAIYFTPLHNTRCYRNIYALLLANTFNEIVEYCRAM